MKGEERSNALGKQGGVLLVFLLDVVVRGEPGPRRRDQAPQRDSTPSHFEELGENLEEEEEEERLGSLSARL